MSPMEGLSSLMALGLLYLAYQQHQTNRNRLRMDLFDRRYKVFEAVKNYVGRIMTKEGITHEIEYQFFDETEHTDFLFDEDLSEYLRGLSRRAHELNTMPEGPEREKCLKLFYKYSDTGYDLFKKYMDLAKCK